MKRKTVSRTGWIFIIIAVVQYIAIGLVFSSIKNIEWVEKLSKLLLACFVCTGTGFVVISRNEKSLKNFAVNETDERHVMINTKASSVTLVCFGICYVVAYLYMKFNYELDMKATLVLIAPFLISAVIYWISVLIFKNKY